MLTTTDPLDISKPDTRDVSIYYTDTVQLTQATENPFPGCLSLFSLLALTSKMSQNQKLQVQNSGMEGVKI